MGDRAIPTTKKASPVGPKPSQPSWGKIRTLEEILAEKRKKEASAQDGAKPGSASVSEKAATSPEKVVVAAKRKTPVEEAPPPKVARADDPSVAKPAGSSSSPTSVKRSKPDSAPNHLPILKALGQSGEASAKSLQAKIDNVAELRKAAEESAKQRKAAAEHELGKDGRATESASAPQRRATEGPGPAKDKKPDGEAGKGPTTEPARQRGPSEAPVSQKEEGKKGHKEVGKKGGESAKDLWARESAPKKRTVEGEAASDRKASKGSDGDAKGGVTGRPEPAKQRRSGEEPGTADSTKDRRTSDGEAAKERSASAAESGKSPKSPAEFGKSPKHRSYRRPDKSEEPVKKQRSGPAAQEVLDAVKLGGIQDVRQWAMQGLIDLGMQDTDRYTVLHSLCQRNHAALVAILIEKQMWGELGSKRACLDARDKYGITPLALAAVNGNTEAATLLLRNGAGTGLRDFKGKTAFDLAKDYGENGICQLISSHTKKSQ